DHKFDPIEQEEYYQFRAFFEPYHIRTDRLAGTSAVSKAGMPRALDAYLDVPTFLFVRGNEAAPDKSKALAPAVPRALGGKPLTIQPLALPLAAYRPDKLDFVILEVLEASAAKVVKAQAALAPLQLEAARTVLRSLSPDALLNATGL